jgi:hypothetical protein
MSGPAVSAPFAELIVIADRLGAFVEGLVDLADPDRSDGDPDVIGAISAARDLELWHLRQQGQGELRLDDGDAG